MQHYGSRPVELKPTVAAVHAQQLAPSLRSSNTLPDQREE